MRLALLALLATGLLGAGSPAPLLAQVDVLTWHNDNARTGQNLAEAILTPANVNSTNFGKLFSVAVDGKVDAQPLYASALSIAQQGTHNVVYVATEHDSVYAIDADTGTILWKVSVLGTGETTSDSRNCNQVVPEIGITATPVIDRATGLLYVTAMSKDGSGAYHQRLHSLDLASGADRSIVEVQATTPGTGDGSSNGTVTFAPGQYKDRPGLLLVGSTLYTSWGSHCDIRPYSGWLIAYSTTTGQQTGVVSFAPNGSDAAPWNAGAGPAADAAGNVFISLGNGTFDTTLTAQGFPSKGDYGNAVVKLSMAGGQLTPIDYWTMYNSDTESGYDTDLGSGGVMLLPVQVDSKGKAWQLAVAAGKDHNLYVLNQANMGKFDASSNATLYQELAGALSNGVWSSPAYFDGHVYYGSVASVLRSFDVKGALLSSSPSSSTEAVFSYPGTTPSVSAYGREHGIVWALTNNNPAVLHAYDATNLATELYNSSQAAGSRDQFGPGNKFIAPTIANGKVYVGTPNSVAVFGILPHSSAPLADGDYNITNAQSALLLTDNAKSAKVSTEITQSAAGAGLTQTWFLAWQGNGYYAVQNPATGLFLSAPEGSSASGTPVLHEQPRFDDTQLWSLVHTSVGYQIQNKGNGLVLGSPSSTATGIQLQTAAAGSNQGWSFAPAR
jgi:outer membrane protein assembly factor BamB